jgi:hypothetical protein
LALVLFILAVAISLGASVALARANPTAPIPQEGNRGIGLFTVAWVLVCACLVGVLIAAEHLGLILALVVATVAIAPLTIVRRKHNAAVRRASEGHPGPPPS